VRPHAAEADQPLIVKAGRHHIDVGQVGAAVIRVVVDEHVARFDLRESADHGAHGVRHRAQMNRQIRALRDHVAVPVEDAAGVVAGDLEQRRIGGLGEDDLHLLGGRDQRVLDHLEPRRIDFGRGPERRVQCVGHDDLRSIIVIPGRLEEASPEPKNTEPDTDAQWLVRPRNRSVHGFRAAPLREVPGMTVWD